MGANLCFAPAGDASARLSEMIELDHVITGDLPTYMRRQRPQIFLNVPARFRPNAVGVRVVSPPEDVVLAHQRDDRLDILVLLVGRISLPPKIVARLHGEAEAAGAVLVLCVQAVEDIRDPGHARLAENELELRILFTGA